MFKRIYGWDSLSTLLVLVSIPFLLSAYTVCLSIVIWLYVLFRTFSRNMEARAREKRSFEAWVLRIASKSGAQEKAAKRQEARRKREAEKDAQRKRREEAKNYRYFSCPKCHAKLRVPRGKGKLRLTCTQCGEKFIKNT